MLRQACFWLLFLLTGTATAHANVGFDVEWLGSGTVEAGLPESAAAQLEVLEPGLINDPGGGGWWMIRPVADPRAPLTAARGLSQEACEAAAAQAESIDRVDRGSAPEIALGRTRCDAELAALPHIVYFVGGFTSTVSMWLPGLRPGSSAPVVRSMYGQDSLSWSIRYHLALVVPSQVNWEDGLLLHISDERGRRVKPMVTGLDEYLASVTLNRMVIACSATALLLMSVLSAVFARNFSSPAYAWLSLLALLSAIYLLTLNSELFNLPGFSALAQWGVAVSRTNAMLACLAACLFLTTFLDLRRRKRASLHIYRALAVIFVAMAFIPWLERPGPGTLTHQISNTAILAMVVLTIWEAVRSMRDGHNAGRYLVWGWSPSFLAMAIWIFAVEDLLPIGPANLQLMVAPTLVMQMVVLLFGVANDSERLRRERDTANQAAGHDPLTGALNRRAFDQHLPEMQQRCGSVGLVYLDVDHFKRVNDNYSHGVGDACLRQLVWRLQHMLTDKDALFRQGGEEFVIALCGGELAEFTERAEALRAEIADRPFDCEGLKLPLTVSMGVSVWRAGEVLDAALHRADQCLYEAKRSGRNRVVTASPVLPTPAHEGA